MQPAKGAVSVSCRRRIVTKIKYLMETWSSVAVWNDSIFACERFNADVNSSPLCACVRNTRDVSCECGRELPVTVGQMSSTSSVSDAQTRALRLTIHRAEQMVTFELTSPGIRTFRWVVLAVFPRSPTAQKGFSRRLPKNLVVLVSHTFDTLRRSKRAVCCTKTQKYASSSPTKWFQATPALRKITETVFKNYKFMLLDSRNSIYIITEHFRVYFRLFFAIGPSCCVKALPFCTKTGLILSIGLVADTALRLTI